MDKTSLKRVVGLRYDPEEGLPRVILKGCGPLADEILRCSSYARKPQIVRNDALLQQLYRLPIDGEIGPDLYRLVAIILVHVFAVDAAMKGEKLD